MNGVRPTVNYLQRLGVDHFNLIQEFGTWILELDPEVAIKVFDAFFFRSGCIATRMDFKDMVVKLACFCFLIDLHRWWARDRHTPKGQDYLVPWAPLIGSLCSVSGAHHPRARWSDFRVPQHTGRVLPCADPTGFSCHWQGWYVQKSLSLLWRYEGVQSNIFSLAMCRNCAKDQSKIAAVPGRVYFLQGRANFESPSSGQYVSADWRAADLMELCAASDEHIFSDFFF